MKEKWTQISTNNCITTGSTKNQNKIHNILKNIKRKSYEELKKSADATADAKAKYDAQLLQAFKDKKLEKEEENIYRIYSLTPDIIKARKTARDFALALPPESRTNHIIRKIILSCDCHFI